MDSTSLQPGLYLGLEEEIYFEDEALSYSNLKTILSDPETYWKESPWNQERPAKRKETDRLAKGKLFHCLLLEPEKFGERYFIMPGGVWSDNKKMVSRSEYQDTLRAISLLKQMKNADKLFNPAWGYPEVVAVWEDKETGVMCRAKHDFFCWEWTADYKTVDKLEDHFVHFTIKRYMYHIQQAHYLKSRIGVREMLKAGKADFYGDFSEKFMDEFLAGDGDFFQFVFQQKDEPFRPMVTWMDERGQERGEQDRLQAIMIYQKYLEIYGKHQPWPSVSREGRPCCFYNGFHPQD